MVFSDFLDAFLFCLNSSIYCTKPAILLIADYLTSTEILGGFRKLIWHILARFHVAHVGPTCASREPTSGRGRPHSENCAKPFCGEVRLQCLFFTVNRERLHALFVAFFLSKTCRYAKNTGIYIFCTGSIDRPCVG